MKNLIEKKEKIAYRLRYASRQGWATELLEKETSFSPKKALPRKLLLALDNEKHEKNLKTYLIPLGHRTGLRLTALVNRPRILLI